MEEQLSLFDFDASDLKNGWICGCDEAGRGPLAGPVTVAAVILPPDFNTSILNDSKKMSEKKREEAALVIKEKAVAYSVVFIDEKTIDKINILRATMQGMKQCYEEIRKDHEIAAYYVDGNRKPDISDGTYVEAVVKGDGKIPQIMAASILAKTERDHYMKKMDELYPAYGFAANKGYGTKSHYEALAKYGPCPIHRKTFLPKEEDSALEL